MLDGLGMRKPIVVESLLQRGRKRDGVTPLIPSATVHFELELAEFGEEWAGAVQRARDLSGQPAALDEVTLVSLHVATVELTFEENDPSQAFRYGTAHFTGLLPEAFPFPFVPGRVSPARPGDIEFSDALEAASLHPGSIQVDEIEELEGYWVFPVRGIGYTGSFAVRRTGRVIPMGSPMSSTMWIWGYERGLLEDEPGDIVIEQVNDPARAFASLKRFARITRDDLDSLPLTLLRCASWRAIVPLHDAGDAITWRVAAA